MPGKVDKAIERMGEMIAEGFDPASGPDESVITVGYYGSKTRQLEQAVEKMRQLHPGARIELIDLKNAPRKGARDR